MSEAIVKELKQLENERGELTPQSVVERAHDPESLLHEYFTWDDQEAAYKWRLEQARRLIRSVRLQINETQTNIRSVAYVRDPSKPDKETGYVSTASIRTDKERAREAVKAEIDRAISCMSRAYEVAHAVGMANEIDSLRAELERVRKAA